MQLVERIKRAVRDVNDYPKPGIIFKDLTPVFSDPALMQDIVLEFTRKYANQRIDAIAAVEARGFIFGSILAHCLKCRFVPVRKAGKLPYKTIGKTYSLEYGSASVEMHVDAIQPGWNVLVHDDLLATGGTAAAAADLVKESHATVSGFSFLINLAFLPGEQLLMQRYGMKPDYLVSY